VAVIDVEDQHAMPAVFEIIADARLGDVEQFAFGLVRVGRGGQATARLSQKNDTNRRN